MPELGSNRQFDAARLRDMRKRADSASKGKEEAEAIALECMEDIAEISSGKVVSFFQFCLHTKTCIF